MQPDLLHKKWFAACTIDQQWLVSVAVLDFYASFSTLRKFYKGGEFILSSYKIKDKKERYHGSILKLDHEIKSFFF